MRHVFIDLGAGSGDDIQGFYNLGLQNKLTEVFAFEANPERTTGIKNRFPEVQVFTAAVGTEDTTSKMYLGKTLNTSSLNENKVSVNKNNYIEVEVIDLCKWMKENFTSEDYITMVMDIEGGEYDLLAKMEQEGMWDWINEFYIEFHGEKIADFDMQIEEDLTLKLIKKFNNKVYIFRKHNHDQFVKLNAEGV